MAGVGRVKENSFSWSSTHSCGKVHDRHSNILSRDFSKSTSAQAAVPLAAVRSKNCSTLDERLKYSVPVPGLGLGSNPIFLLRMHCRIQNTLSCSKNSDHDSGDHTISFLVHMRGVDNSRIPEQTSPASAAAVISSSSVAFTACG